MFASSFAVLSLETFSGTELLLFRVRIRTSFVRIRTAEKTDFTSRKFFLNLAFAARHPLTAWNQCTKNHYQCRLCRDNGYKTEFLRPCVVLSTKTRPEEGVSFHLWVHFLREGTRGRRLLHPSASLWIPDHLPLSLPTTHDGTGASHRRPEDAGAQNR